MKKSYLIKKTLFVFLIICSQANNSLFAQFGPQIFLAPAIVNPTRVSLVDLDGDGYDDILTSANSEWSLGWFRNLSGTGEFSAFKAIKSQQNVGRNHYAYDWDGDGDLDVFTLSANVDKVFYYENLSGEGEFSSPRTILEFGISGSNYIQIQIADLENDGDNDLFIYDNYRIRLFRNTGQDFDFDAPVLIGGTNINIFTAGDIDNDQDIDVVFQEDDFLIVRRYNAATGAFSGPEYLPQDNQTWIRTLGLADFDGDGTPDIYLSDNISKVFVYLNNGLGTFNNYEIVFSGFGDPRDDLYAVDMDADGDKDLLHLYNDSELLWFKNLNGTGSFSNEILIWEGDYPVDGGWQALAGKLNNDSYPDVIALYNKSNIYSEITWFEGTAQQTNLDRKSLYFQEERFNDWGIADINNDGKVDLVASAYDNQIFYNNEVVYIFLADGLENAYHHPVRIPSLMSNISLVDLDEDGDIDIVGSNDDENWAGWLENDNLNFTTHTIDGSFYNSASATTNFPAIPVDVDGDGDLDILLFKAGAVAWRENLGNAQTWGPLTSLYENSSASIYDVLSIDIDADNDLDFVASASGRLIFIIKSNITGGYEFLSRNLQPDQINFPRYLKSDDIDGDGDADLLFSTYDEELYWLENNGVDLTFPDLHLIYDDFAVYRKTFYVEDMNNDGTKDILWSSDSQTKILQNDGNGNFTTFFDSGSNYQHAIPFDTDLDGDLDLVFAKSESFSVRKNYANFSRIKGTVYWDENNNGQLDSLEMGLSQHQVLIEPASLLAWSAAQGSYEFAVEPNTYELSCIPADSWAMTTDSIVSITVPDSTMNIQTVNFGMRINTDTIITQVHLASGPTRCGFEVPFWINYHADSYKRTEGSIYLHLNPLAQFLSATPMPYTVTDTLLTWNFSDLIPLESKTIALNFQIAGVEEIGNFIDIMAIMDITEADTIAARDTFLYRSNITCSYDPNDKQVSPSIPGYPNYTLFGEELMYTVRFENTGLDTAFNIFIEDQLDRDLDWTSFRLAGSSHPVRVTRSEAGLLTFYFDNILLPYTGIDPVGSQGFVSYTIKPLDSLELNEYVLNEASIFFDFNPPIITNRVSNIYVDEYPVHFDLEQPACFGGQDGRIIPDFLSDGFLYYWNNTLGEPVIDSLENGTYDFSLYRYDGTLVNTSTVTLGEPSELLIALSTTPETDFQANGTALVEIGGGTPPYTIRWSTDPVAEGEMIEGLASGTYQVTVTDANGCEQVGSVFLDLIVQTDAQVDEDAAFSIFPNPADNNLWVSSGSEQEVIISIYHLNGQLIKSEGMRIANKHAIDIKKFPSAVYLIKIFSQGKPVFIRRFTVVH